MYDSILVAAGRTADRWVTRGIAIGGNFSLFTGEGQQMVNEWFTVVAFVTILQGLFPKLGLWMMNVSRGEWCLYLVVDATSGVGCDRLQNRDPPLHCGLRVGRSCWTHASKGSARELP